MLEGPGGTKRFKPYRSPSGNSGAKLPRSRTAGAAAAA
eukprot:gene3665-3926_t